MCIRDRRPPFDMPVADAELVMGAWTEYTGLRFAFFLLAEYAGIVVMSLLFAVLWLGGWHGPFEDTLGWLWTLLKGFGVAVLVIWVRVAWPRLREDQLQRLAWLWLVPIALAQLLLTGAGVVMGWCCLLYTSDAADERSSVDLGGRRIIKKKNSAKIRHRR